MAYDPENAQPPQVGELSHQFLTAQRELDVVADLAVAAGFVAIVTREGDIRSDSHPIALRESVAPLSAILAMDKDHFSTWSSMK